MSVPVVLRPKRPRWFAVTAAIAVASLAVTAAAGWWRGWSPGDWWGLTFGTMAALLMFLAALYPLRRRLAVGPLRTAQDWLQAHVYGSTLAAIFVLIHMGFRLPGGQFGWWLFALTLWTTVSGLMGVVLQKWIPTLVTAQLSVEVIYERIPEMVAKIQSEAATTVTGASDVLQRFYDQQVQPAIAGLTPSWSYLLDVHSGRDRRLATFDHIQSFITAEDKDRLADLKSLVTEKIELDAHYSLQRLLRLWPVVHVPPAILLLAAVVAHIATVWYF
jgi:hypothetical protein